MRRLIEQALEKWKNNPQRMPLILRGARQVGKSYVVEKFGRAHFESVITVNFELQPELKDYFNQLDPAVICSKLEIAINQKIIPGQSLLFLDEIQNCPNAIKALRYFKEKLSSLHVIAAGSLLEFVINEAEFSFPVGRVQLMYLKPLSFVEFLLALKKDILVEHLNSMEMDTPFDPVIHNMLIDEARRYILLGGMPAVVQCYLQTQSFVECQLLLKEILHTYRSDFVKYATKTEYKYLQIFFDKSPALVCKHFKYSHIDISLRSTVLKVAVEQLEHAGILLRIFCTNASGIPLHAHIKEHKFKLLFLDVGLMNAAQRLDLELVWKENLAHLNNGIQAEQFVGQELLASQGPYEKGELFYWDRDKPGAMAEVDFVIQLNTTILPIEVKAGTTGTLRSLTQFLKEKEQNSPFGIRISEHPLSFHDKILSIPFYLIEQIPRIVRAIKGS